MTDLHESVSLDANPRSFSNQVQADKRIMRRGKEVYGLRSWGGEEYSGIRDELEQAVERAGGRVDLEELISTFVDQFGVSAHSVRAYAAERRFIRHADGTLAMRTGDDPEVAHRQIPAETTPGLFLLHGIWHLRAYVDSELLRGSGRVVRSGVAIAAGLEPDLTLGFEYERGSVMFSWSGNQPYVGSLRGIANAHGCTERDLLFIPLDGAEPRTCRVTRGTDRDRANGIRRLGLEMGLGSDEVDDDDPACVGRILGLPLGADWHDIVDRLRDRGENHLLEFISDKWQ